MKNRFKFSKIFSISAGHFFHDIYTSILAPMLPLLVDKFGITMAMAGVLDVVRKSPTLFNPFFGVIADRICVKYIVILTPAITAISMSLLGVAPNYYIFMILLFVAGISSALFHVPSPVLIKRYSHNRTGSGMSFYMVGGELSRSVGPLLITAAISMYGLEGSWRIMPLGIIASLILFYQLKDLERSSSHVIKKSSEKALSVLRRYFKLFANISAFVLFRAGMKLALTLYLPVYFTSRGSSLWMAGVSLAILQFAGVIGVLLSGFLSDKIGRKKTLLISAIISPILMFSFLYTDSVLQIVILVLLGMSVFAPGPVILALVQDTDTERPSLMNSIYMTLSFGISSIMALAVGFMADAWSLNVSFNICAAISLVSIPVVLLFQGANKKTKA